MKIPCVPLMRCLGLAAILSSFIAGCGSGSAGVKGTRGQVSGRVTLGDEPVCEGSTVMFQSKSGPSYLASGTVNATGEFRLAFKGSRELPAGTYMVQISPPIKADSTRAIPVDPREIDIKKMQQDAKATKLPFPKKYSSYATSQLIFEVEAGPNKADFKLTK